MRLRSVFAATVNRQNIQEGEGQWATKKFWERTTDPVWKKKNGERGGGGGDRFPIKQMKS